MSSGANSPGGFTPVYVTSINPLTGTPDSPSTSAMGEVIDVSSGDIYYNNGNTFINTSGTKSINLVNKLRKSVAKASAMDWKTSFLQAPPAWQASTAYAAGQAVLAGGNWYVALTSGTSGGTAPTWTTTPQLVSPFMSITDGTVLWSYYDVALPLVASDSSYTVSFTSTADATLTNIFTPVTGSFGSMTGAVLSGNSNNEFIIVGSGSTIVMNSKTSAILACPLAAYTVSKQTPGGLPGIAGSNGLYRSDGNVIQHYLYWEINTDESTTIQFESAGSDTRSVTVQVDGVDMQVGAFQNTITGNASVFTTIAITGKTKKRKIRVFGLAAIRSVRIKPNSAFFPVEMPNLKMLAFGDSFFAGALPQGPSRIDISIPQVVARELGLTGCTECSTGGTGIEVGTAPVYNWAQKIANTGYTNLPANSLVYSSAIVSYDIVWIEWPNGNDIATGTIAANLLLFLKAWRTLQPTALIILHCGWPNNIYDAMDTIGQAQFAAWADPNSLYISAGSATKAGLWISGTGYCLSGYTAPAGNSSLLRGADGLHPNDSGILIAGMQSAEAIKIALGV